MSASRPGWTEYFLELAIAASKRSTCPRRSVGALVVKNRRVLGTGYNGSPPGAPHCTDVGCLLLEEGKPNCHRTIHAEQNAIIQALTHSLEDLQGTTLYCTDFPCYPCAKLIVAVGIREMVYCREYLSSPTRILFDLMGVKIEQNPRMEAGLW